jgi:hypothetical protein
MEILSDRIGILLKYGKMMGSLTKRYFFIDNKGILHYTDKEGPIQELLKSKTYDNQKFIQIFQSAGSKTIQLQECGISGIKTYLEDNFDLKGRSYFELYLKVREYRSILIFSIKEDYIKSLHNYLRELNVESTEEGKLDEKELQNFDTEPVTQNFSKFNEFINFDNINKEKHTRDAVRDIFLNAKSKAYMENVEKKLAGKFVNQKDWDKDCIKIINPSSNQEEYEEAWVELENGSNYSGPVKNGMPHGFGKEYRPDGSLYTGYFFRGKWHGPGTITNETLDTYQGEFIDGCICGI